MSNQAQAYAENFDGAVVGGIGRYGRCSYPPYYPLYCSNYPPYYPRRGTNNFLIILIILSLLMKKKDKCDHDDENNFLLIILILFFLMDCSGTGYGLGPVE